MELKFEWDEEKDRYIAIGMAGGLLFVVFTGRGEKTRLISARLETESEEVLLWPEFYN